MIHLRTRARLFVRHNIRNRDLGLVVVAAAIGVVIAAGVVLTKQAVGELHHLLFGLSIETDLSGADSIERWRVLLVPPLGGLAYGLVAYLLWRWRPRDIVDAIEANALHGGRMSLSDSLRLTGMNVLSTGVGASVRPRSPSSGRGSLQRSAGRSSCGGTTCAPLSGAARQRRSPPPSMPRSPAPSTHSS